MNTANSLSLISISLLSSWIITGPFFHLPRIKLVGTCKRFILVLLVFIFIRYAPIYAGMSLAYILRGIISDLSITTTLLLLTFIYGEIRGDNNCYKINSFVWLLIFIIDLILCLSVFGSIPFDLYAVGYFPCGLLLFYLIMQVLFWYFNKKFAVFWLLALLGYLLKLLPSPNFWDYLIDPVLWLIALAYLIVFIALRCKGSCLMCKTNIEKMSK